MNLPIEAERLDRFCRVLPVAPMPHDPEHTVYVSAGTVTFGIECRTIGPEVVQQYLEAERLSGSAAASATTATISADILEDVGASVHVLETASGREWLRFDAFPTNPHYHYLGANGENLQVKFDSVAEPDFVAWTLGRIRLRLPEMLRAIPAPAFADAVDMTRVRAALPEVTLAIANQLAHSATALDPGEVGRKQLVTKPTVTTQHDWSSDVRS